MDRIEQDKLLEKILGKRQVWFDRTDVEKILNTLYSEPQVGGVPATLPPDELLAERDLQEFIEGTLVLAYMEGQANSNASATKLAKEIIAKCRQSEANIEEQLTEIVCSQYTRAEKAEARIKELETLNYKQSQMKCNRCPYNNPQESAIRADQPQHYVDANNKRVKRGVR